MKIAFAKSNIDFNNKKISNISSLFLDEVRLNSNCKLSDIQSFIDEIDTMFDKNIELHSSVELTHSLSKVKNSSINYIINSIEYLNGKIELYRNIYIQLVSFLDENPGRNTSEYQVILNTLSSFLRETNKELFYLKELVLNLESNIDLIDIKDFYGSSATE